MKKVNVAILGATGAVGREMLKVLAERKFPVNKLKALASSRSAGMELPFGKGAVVKDAVLLPGAIVKDGAKVINAIVGENSIIEEGVDFGSADADKDYAFCGNNVVIGKEE